MVAMLQFAWILLFGAGLASAAPSPSNPPRERISAPASSEVSIRSEFQIANQPLTTETFWRLQPRELNPHRARWLLSRKVELSGIRAIADRKHGARFKVQATGLLSSSLLHLRGPGPWFRDFMEFNCEPEPNAWFATREGSEVAGRAAEDAWQSVLSSRNLKLALQLEKVTEPSASEAVESAQRVFEIWLAESESEWWVKAKSAARQAEWRFYLGEASRGGTCKPGEVRSRIAAMPSPAPEWPELMQRPSLEPSRHVLARSPARKWGGLYSIRLSVIFGDKTLSGQFLVDSGSAVSVVSPLWLKAQGINPVLVEVPQAAPQRIVWSGGSGVARRAQAFRVSIADFKLSFADFLLMETELFTPPQFLSSCCDGMIGADFLRLYAVEFTPGPPPALTLYDREGYSEGQDAAWLEVASLPSGEPVSSSCVMSSDASKVVGARWDTGSEAAVDIHRPWEPMARKAQNPWKLSCGKLEVAERIPVTYPEARMLGESRPLSVRIPGFNVGMEVLSRGPVTFDLANGRLWFDRASLAKSILTNQSGLDLAYSFNAENDRVLRVKRIRPGSLAATQLGYEGLKVGMQVLQIDDKPTEEIDSWEIERRLSGAYGSTVTLQWKNKTGLKVAPLDLAAAPAPRKR